MTLAPPTPPLHDEVVRLTPVAPEHPDGTVHETKAEAEAAEQAEDE